MVSVLVIQFRTNLSLIYREQQCLAFQLTKAVGVEFINALNPEIDWHQPENILRGYAGVIFGGSGDLDFDGDREEGDVVRQTSLKLLDKLRPFFQYIFSNDIPTLGICFGHQIIGAFAGANVKYSKTQTKVCSHELRFVVDKNNLQLFANLPESFFAHYGHKDVLDCVPCGATLLLSGGERCQVSALKYRNNIFTVQFHPELTYLDMVERVKNSPGYLPEGIFVEEVFKDDSSSNMILQNFAEFVQQHAKGSLNKVEANCLIQPTVD